MRTKLVFLQVGRTSEALARARGDYDVWFRDGLEMDGAMDVVRIVAGDSLPELAPYGGVVVSGSFAMVTDREPWSVATAEWLRRAIDDGRHVLGVCYGHQLIADALGGRVDYNPNGRQIGSVEARLTDAGRDDPLLSGLGDPLVVQTSHSQCVLQPPVGATVLARSPKDAHHAIRFGERVWGVQFHPEFDGEVARTYVVERAERIRAEGLDPERLARDVRHSDHGRSILRRFGQMVRARSAR